VLWVALNRAISLLEAESDRRVLVVISDGDDFCRRDFGSACVSPREVGASATREDVMIYSIAIGGTHRQDVATQPEIAVVMPHMAQFQQPVPLNDQLPDLARGSGGDAFHLAHAADLGATMTGILDELRNQYLIGIATDRQETHTVNVEAARPGLRVRSRRDYGGGR
jgi:hypothetical protein